MLLTSIAGLGPKRIAALKEMGIDTPWDLLQYVPRKWRDERQITKIRDAQAGQWVVFDGHIASVKVRYGKRQWLSVILRDDSGSTEMFFWHAIPYWQSKLKEDIRVIVTGEAGKLSHPEMRFLKDGEIYAGCIKPIYSESANIKSELLKKIIKQLLEKDLRLILEPNEHICPPELLSYLGISSLKEILKSQHCPQTMEEIAKARKENKMLVMLPFCLRMAMRRKLLADSGISRELDLQKIDQVRNNLSFSLTAGQAQALEKIKEGLMSKNRLHALLHGDVGSGKTVVALLTMLGICGAGKQAACMVPTDILARQHFATMEKFFRSVGLKLALLVGAMTAAERKDVLTGLKNGEIDAVVGTHALFSKDVQYCNLTFVIIDEQHRFGVRQREALLAKGDKADLLVMTSTPIPRSLVMTVYGDLESIALKEKPPGRKTVITKLVKNEKRDDMKSYLYNNAKRCYWVVNRVQEDEQGEVKCVGNIYDELKSFRSDWKIAVVHGQMPDTERDANLNAFAKGEISLLVCTTVIEVGVNVPEANIIVIDRPESFGLAQLHQLRGRVGRGDEQAWCFLLSEENDMLGKFAKTNDGFEIAEMDLQNRGAGNLEGSEQSGSWILRSFDWEHDHWLIEKIIATANRILDNEPNFSPEVLQKIQDWYNDRKFEKIEDGVH